MMYVTTLCDTTHTQGKTARVVSRTAATKRIWLAPNEVASQRTWGKAKEIRSCPSLGRIGLATGQVVVGIAARGSDDPSRN